MPQYNNVFERLMRRAEERGEPIVGMIAYAIYKQHKAEHCKSAEAAGKALSEDELKTYHLRYSDVVLESLEENARSSLLTFADVHLEQNRDAVVRKAMGDFKDDLSSEITESTKFWKSFWPGFASSAAFFVVAAVFAILWAFTNQDSIRSVMTYISPSDTQKEDLRK